MPEDAPPPEPMPYWLLLDWPPGYAARVFLLLGLVLALAAAVLVRLASETLPLEAVHRTGVGAVAVFAAFTLGRFLSFLAAVGAYGVAYAAVFPLITAATRTETTIRTAIDLQIELLILVAAWTAGAALILASKKGIQALHRRRQRER